MKTRPIPSPPAASLRVASLRLASILATAVLAGCGGSLTAGGFAEVDVAVSGDAPGNARGAPPGGSSGGLALSTAGEGAIPPITTFDDGPEGEIELEFRLFLVRPDGTEEPLSRNEIEVEVDLSGDIEVDAIRATVAAGRYSALRIVFSEIEVEIDRGVVIGGVPVQGRIDIELEDDELVEVVRPLDLRLQDGDRVELLVDINAGIWLQAIDPSLRRVAERVFAEAISVAVR